MPLFKLKDIVKLALRNIRAAFPIQKNSKSSSVKHSLDTGHNYNYKNDKITSLKFGVPSVQDIMKDTVGIRTCKFKIHDYNSVFQAEVLAISSLVEQGTLAGVPDTLSSMERILVHKNISLRDLEIQPKLKSRYPYISSHMSKHILALGASNWQTVRVKEEAIEQQSPETNITTPMSFLKAKAKTKLSEKWQLH